MTQIATPESIATEIDNVSFVDGNNEYTLSSMDGKLWVDIRQTNQGNKQSERFQIVLTTGSHHYQVYWYETDMPRSLGQLPYVYLIDEKRWIPRRSAFLTPPSDKTDDEHGRWNVICIKCHTTQGIPNPVILNNLKIFDTRVVEFGIACEACHGEGNEHAIKMMNPLMRYYFYLTDKQDPTIVNPSKLSADRSSQVCGQCHSIHLFLTDEGSRNWLINGYKYRAGDNLNDFRKVINYIDEDDSNASEIEKHMSNMQRFWADGMVRLAGREYNGLVLSPCFNSNDFSCLSCHRLHKQADDKRSNKVWANDLLKQSALSNSACIQCHEKFSEKIKLIEHTNHKNNSSGSQCYNCHMPHTSYGLRKAIRSHLISSPNINESIEYGRPNACNLCHLDKSLQWTNQLLYEWYEQPELAIDQELKTLSFMVIQALKGDAAQRALAFYSMGKREALVASGSSWLAPFLAEGLVDPYDAVRQIAYRSLQSITGYSDLDYDFLDDEERRNAIKTNVIQSWKNQNTIQQKPAVLINNNQLQTETIRDLINNRDDIPISLLE